ncbi:MAG: putative Ig domain-containing protein, partial [Acidobacteriota bacterium]|nr:putative Ig domain-containing protein [Acidobacteriota bacterium]
MKIANNGFGVFITAASNNLIGGTASGAGNVISGNDISGVAIDGTATGNQVQGNLIGTNAAGTAAIGNMAAGVDMNASNNIIGGTVTGARNVISGNGSDQSGGVVLSDGAAGNQILGNFIGTDITGTMDVGNSLFGVRIFNAANGNTLGGTTAGAGNVISGNNNDGVQLQDATSVNNLVQGNYIGLNAAGTAALPNDLSGVRIQSTSNNTVGGTASGARNIISGNGQHGIAISFSNNNLVAGNFIGTDVNGTADLGNTLSGVALLFGGTNNTIGGTTAAARNIISGNDQHGVLIIGASDSIFSNFVRGNFIGTNAAGTAAIANSQDGVNINESADNIIGGTAAGEGNLISGNTLSGVSIINGNAVGNRIQGNAIYSNGAIGVDLGNNLVTPNDAGDPDTGENNLQNFPVLTSITSTGTISGSLDSTSANSAYPVRIEFFGNTTCDPSGNGEGEVFLGSTTVSAPGSFTASVTLVPGKSLITATATDNNGNTSEFSACQQADTPPTITAAAPPARQQDSPPINSQIATVSDPDQAPNTLMVQVNGAASATVNGVTVSNLTINGAGQVFADIVASCTATNASFTLTVTDNQGAMAMTTLNVTVTANTPPTLSYASPQSVLVGQALTVNPATGPSDNGSIASITVQSAGTYTGTISVDSAGVVTLSNAKPVGSHTIAIQATDNCGLSTISPFTLNVNCQVITVTPPSTNTGTAGTPFSQTFTQSGGIGATTFSTASTLPTGLALASNGVLSGTPMQAGTFPITVNATDSNGCMGMASYTLTINCPAITVNPPSLPNGTTGAAYSQTISATGGTAPYSFDVISGTLPTGLTLAPGGNLSGTPAQSGTFNFTITATDANGCTGNRAYALVIACPPFAININAPAAVSAGQNLSYDVTLMNPCPDVALNTTLTTNTPANTTFQSITAPAGWTCTAPAAGGTGAISCNNPNFLAGATTPFTIVLRVNPGTPVGTVITNTVTVTGTAPGRPAVTATASAGTTVANNADLSITKIAPATAIAGANTTFNIAVTNSGPSSATTVTLTDVVPINTTFQTFTFPAGWVCTTPAVGGTGTITCNTATLAANATANFALTVKLNSNVACDTAISNTASVQSALADPTPGNNTATATLLAKSQSDLAVNVIAPATATPDTSVVYTVTVTNNGPSASLNTALNNALPAAFSAEAVTTSVGNCTGIGTNSVNCNLGTLPAGATAIVTIQAHVPETCQPTTAVFTATVT